MTYALLSSGRGYLLSRKPLIYSTGISLTFKGLAAEAKASICNSTDVSYGTIKDGCLTIPLSLLTGNEGQISIKVSAYDGTTMYKRWSCELIEYKKLDEGKYLLYPAPHERDEATAQLVETVDRLSVKINELEKKLRKNEETLNKALVGFVTE